MMSVIQTVPLAGKNPLQITNFGLGTAPLSNPNAVSEADAVATIQTALNSGVKLFDTAPLYGLGVAEERVGKALSGVPRDNFVISTKVGRILNEDRKGLIYDYSRDGVLRSIEHSLKRLKLDRLDIVLIHDPDADQVDHEKEAIDITFPALADLRSQGVIKAIGSGMNQWQMLERFARYADPDVFLLAGRYTLLEQTSLAFLKLCKERGIGIFLGGVYNSGILAVGPQPGATYNYAPAPEPILAKTRAIKAVCDKYNVPLNVAALQFALAHPAISALVVGAVKPTEVETNIRSLEMTIPPALWQELRAQGLVEADAPLPI
jgi:D-threo-aldose 1-dehydrogenase